MKRTRGNKSYMILMSRSDSLIYILITAYGLTYTTQNSINSVKEVRTYDVRSK